MCMLTKNIFQTHESYQKLGTFERVCLERWKLMNPEWNYRFTTNDEADVAVRELFPDEYSAYEGFHLGAKNNIRRCALLHKHGGFYADLDMYPVKPLRDYLPTDRQRVLFKYDDRDMWLGGILASAAGDPVTLEVAREMINRLMSGQPAPDPSNREAWMGWHFDHCGVHVYNYVYRKHEKLEDALIGADSHPAYINIPVEDVKCLHLATGCWTPSQTKPSFEEQTTYELRMIEVAKEVFGI